jgi:hypothetical protein
VTVGGPCCQPLQVPSEASGVLVVSVDPLSSAAGAVEVNDVLLEVGSMGE